MSSREILFHRANLRIAVPSEQRFFALVPIDLLHIADIQIMVAYLVILFQIADNGNTAVGRDFDGTALHLGKLNVEFGNLIGVAPRGAAAAEDSIRNFCAGNGENNFSCCSAPSRRCKKS